MELKYLFSQISGIISRQSPRVGCADLDTAPGQQNLLEVQKQLLDRPCFIVWWQGFDARLLWNYVNTRIFNQKSPLFGGKRALADGFSSDDIVCISHGLHWRGVFVEWNKIGFSLGTNENLYEHVFYSAHWQYSMVNIMGAGGLATQGARASATMILTSLNRDNAVPARWD